MPASFARSFGMKAAANGGRRCRPPLLPRAEDLKLQGANADADASVHANACASAKVKAKASGRFGNACGAVAVLIMRRL